MTPVALDAGALIALERRDSRMIALADELHRMRRVGHFPPALSHRCGEARLASTRSRGCCEARRCGWSEEFGYRLGLLLARSGTSDVVDAHVALLGRLLGATVLTSDPDGLAAMDSALRLVHI